MKWVTRKRIQVNRAATAWLVRRFIDPQAEFIFVDPEQVAAFQDREGAADRRTGRPLPASGFPGALLVRGARRRALRGQSGAGGAGAHHPRREMKDLDAAPECRGLLAISRGFPLVARDNHETMEKTAFLYDALYASLKQRQSQS